MELFLGLTGVLQAYRIEPPLEGLLNMVPIVTAVSLPQTNLLRITPV